MIESTASLLWSIVFGSIGFGFFLYGKKQKNVVAFTCGIALMVYPYFVTNTYLMVLIGVGIIAIPYFLRDI